MSTDYVPPPSAKDWQTKVNAAINEGSLRWTPAFGTTWSLDGDCPNCLHHQFSQVFDMKIWRGALRSDAAAVQSSGEPTVELEVVCTGLGCGTEHGPAGTPCGAGVGVQISCLLSDDVVNATSEV